MASAKFSALRCKNIYLCALWPSVHDQVDLTDIYPNIVRCSNFHSLRSSERNYQPHWHSYWISYSLSYDYRNLCATLPFLRPSREESYLTNILRQKIIILERQRTTRFSVSNTDTTSNRDSLAESKGMRFFGDGTERCSRRASWSCCCDLPRKSMYHEVFTILKHYLHV
jgi:hypothetical protein